MPQNAFLQSEQTIEVDVSGPGDVNKLFVVSGLADFNSNVSGLGGGGFVTVQNTVEAHVGPDLTTSQFRRATATASLSKITFTGGDATFGSWQVTGVDADFDDDTGKVQFQCDILVRVDPGATSAQTIVSGVGFQVLILAAMGN